MHNSAIVHNNPIVTRLEKVKASIMLHIML